MTEMIMRRDLQPLVRPAGRIGERPESEQFHPIAIVKDASFGAVVLFALTGLLASLGVTMLLTPSAASAVLEAFF
jgi:hypothetical protein